MTRQNRAFVSVILITLIAVCFIVCNAFNSDLSSPLKKVEPQKGERETYIIFLSGLNSSCDGTPYNQMGFEFVRRNLECAGLSYTDEHFLKYSYTGGQIRQGKWYPNPYKPMDTGQPIEFSVLHLKDMVEKLGQCYTRARFLLVGHSLGGRIAFDYVAKYHLEKTEPVKGIITLNSPLIGSIYSLPDILGYVRPIWGSIAVKQLAAEYQLQDELGIMEKKRDIARKLTEKGIHIATFATKQDVIVDPLTACLMDKDGHPLTDGGILSVNLLNGHTNFLFGHMQILQQKKVVDYLLSVYLSSTGTSTGISKYDITPTTTRADNKYASRGFR